MNIAVSLQPYFAAIEQMNNNLMAITESANRIQEAIKPMMHVIDMSSQAANSISRMVQAYSTGIEPFIQNTVAARQNMEVISKAFMQSIPQYDFSGITNAASILADLDFGRLSAATQAVINNTEWLTEDPSIEEIAEKISEAYVAESEDEQRTIDQITAVTKSEKSKLTNEEKALKASYISAVFTVLSFIATIFFGIASLNNKIEIPESTINNVTYVNNYYIQNGYDMDLLNNCGLRIVNRNIKVRLKPDCSSRVTGTLEAGKVVSVTDKHKKWIQITWIDEDGDYISGWIQNYKVSEFEN